MSCVLKVRVTARHFPRSSIPEWHVPLRFASLPKTPPQKKSRSLAHTLLSFNNASTASLSWASPAKPFAGRGENPMRALAASCCCCCFLLLYIKGFVKGTDFASVVGGLPAGPLPRLFGSNRDECRCTEGINPPERGKEPWRSAAAPMLAQSS